MELPNKQGPKFVYVAKASIYVTLESDGRQWGGNVQYGETFYVSPHCACKVRNLASVHSQLILIHFQWEAGQGQASPFETRFKSGKLYTLRMPQVRYWIPDFLRTPSTSETGLYYTWQSHLYAIASAFCSLMPLSASPENDLWHYVEETRNDLLQRYHEPIDIDEIARMSGTGSRFYQAFRRYTGFSPLQFITAVRLNAALELLGQAELSVMQVAHAVGYHDEYYFSRLFKKHMGLSPTEYAACVQRNIVCLSAVVQGDLSALGVAAQLVPGDRLEQRLDASHEHEQPDVIIAPRLPADRYEGLRHKAQIVELDHDDSWKARFVSIGQALGLESVASRWLSHYHRKLDSLRHDLPVLLGGQPLWLVLVKESSYRVLGTADRTFGVFLYSDLQATPPEAARQFAFLDVPSLDDLAIGSSDGMLFFVPKEVLAADAWPINKGWRPSTRCSWA